MNPTIVVGALGDDPTEARLFYGKNVLDALRLLPDESINMVATSPPYWALRDYGVGHQVWGGDPECDHEWGDEIAGRSQSGGTGASTLGAASGGNSISPEGVQRSLERSHAAPKRSSFCSKCWAWRGCLGLEPTPNLFVKHLVLIGREIRRVLHPSGTFWLNLGDSYMSHSASAGAQVGGFEGERQKQEDGYREAAIIGKPSKVPGLKDKDLVGVPWRAALALQADGWWLRNDIIWHKANAMPSSVRDRFSCKYEHVFMFAKQARYFFDLDAVKVPHTSGTYDEEGNFEPNQQWFESGEGQRKMDQTDGQLGHLAASPRRGREEPRRRVEALDGRLQGGALRRVAPAPGRAVHPGRFERARPLRRLQGPLEAAHREGGRHPDDGPPPEPGPVRHVGCPPLAGRRGDGPQHAGGGGRRGCPAAQDRHGGLGTYLRV